MKPRALYDVLLQDLQEVLTDDDICALKSNDKSYQLPPEVIPVRYRAFALGRSFLKKNQDSVAADADNKALSKFLACNQHCLDYRSNPETLEDEYLLGEFFERVYRFFLGNPEKAPISLGGCFDLGRVGPGASLGASDFDFYSKLFSSELTATSPFLLHCYKKWATLNPTWNLAENFRSRIKGEAVVGGSKLSFVKKTEEISRTVCTEPAINMYAQLGLGAWITARLEEHFGILINNQEPINQELARKGSIDGSFGTIDLESASDTIAYSLVKRACPTWFVSLVDVLRSPTTTLPNKETVELHMVSSMGNGFTFPLETALFSCAVEAAYRLSDIRMVKGGPNRNFGVYGDDIVVVRSAYRRVCRLLHLLGFLVNGKKSFNDGYFRESCGADWFRGVPVRGFYLKTCSTMQSLYVAINRLKVWRDEFYCCSLRRTLAFLIRNVKKLYVPMWQSDDAGIKAPRAFVEKLYGQKDGCIRYEYFRSRPPVRRFHDKYWGVTSNNRMTRIDQINWPGAILSYLRGDLREYEMTLRGNEVHYRLVRSKCVSWDYPGVRAEDLVALSFRFGA